MTVASAIFPVVSCDAADGPRRERVHTVETIGVEVVENAPSVANASSGPVTFTPEAAPAPANVVPFASTLRRVG